MAAEIKFYANFKDSTSSTLIDHVNGSGIGFYGAGFGLSVSVGEQQSSTFVTDAQGLEEGAQLNNTAMASVGDAVTPGTVSVNGLSSINTDQLPNYLCPLNIRFTNNDPVKVQNCKLRVFDRNNIENKASGVTTYVYEARHPSSTQSVSNLSQRGRSRNDWVEFAEGVTQIDGVTTNDMPMTSSPGMSGLNTNTSDTNPALGYSTRDGVTHASTQHDWFVAISSEPESIGSKTNYGLYFSLEYLA